MADPAPLPLKVAELPTCELSYTDSFSTIQPADRPESYTTVIGIHGIGFNSIGWTPLMPELPSTIRFIAYNQRSYRGSSPAVPAAAPGGTDATQVYLEDFLYFFQFVVRRLDVPEVPRDGSGPGGVVVLGWSKGTLLCVALLAILSPSRIELPFFPTSPVPEASSVAPLLATHLRSVLLFEAPGSLLSRPPTPNFAAALLPVLPPNKPTDEEFYAGIDKWLEAYSPAKEGEPDAATLPPSSSRALKGEWGKATFEPYCLKHGLEWKLSSDPAQNKLITETALAKNVEEAGGSRLETLPVGWICGARTGDYFEDARQVVVEGLWTQQKGNGVVRKTADRLVPNTNHFAFIHEPRAFAEALVSIIEELGT